MIINVYLLSYWWMILLAIMNTGICNLIFHETAHYCGFKNQNINNYLTMCHYPLLIDSDWKHIHNYLHHCFTNSEYDENYNLERYGNILRHSVKNPHILYFHNFQSIYSIILFTTIFFNKCLIKSILLKKPNIISLLFIFYILGIYNSSIFYGIASLLFTFIAQLSHIQHECIQINTDNKNDFLYNQVSSYEL